MRDVRTNVYVRAQRRWEVNAEGEGEDFVEEANHEQNFEGQLVLVPV